MSVSRLSLLLGGLTCLGGTVTLAADGPQGELIELHSCSVYAGGCTVSSESTLRGRCMLQVYELGRGASVGAALGRIHGHWRTEP